MQNHTEIPGTYNKTSLIKRIKLSDLGTDAFLAGNVLDASFTYLALQDNSKVTEFNSVLYAVINEIGLGPAMILKIILCIVILWILRKTNRKHLLLPLSLIFVSIALINLIVARTQGIDI